MAIRVEIRNGNFVDDTGPDGHGRTGQIRKAFWFSRSISVHGQNLNRGSLIDFLNTRLPAPEKLSKGWFFGLIGGSSDERIRKAFNRVVLPQLTALPAQAPSNTDMSLLTTLKKLQKCDDFYLLDNRNYQFTYLSEGEITQKGGIVLVPNQSTFSDSQYHGLVICKEGEKWILHICPGGGDLQYTLEDYLRIMPIAIENLEKRKITPDAFVIDGRHPGQTLANFTAWQSQ